MTVRLIKVSMQYVKAMCQYCVLFSLSLNVFSVNAWQSETLLATENETPMHQVTITANDGFELVAQYYPGKSDASGVLLLHDCHHDSKSYQTLLTTLSSLGLHALAVDFRGYGESTSEKFSHATIRSNTKDFATYQLEVARLTAFWPSDVLAAHQFLRERLNNNAEMAVVSSGCSALQAIELAEKMRINAFVMITPELTYMQKESFKNLIDMPIYFLSSVYHANTFLTAKELFDWNGDSRSLSQVFKGAKHGDSLLNGRRYIIKNVASWLEDTLDH
ncbi:hypothetical protein Q4489_00255 [Thalassotalea sp. 1_MG-2023]|uniref:hypothetical protein n=1 Tax=Thalassotalea sp. 1_MG-2023 TaxID=3062680 RepID=UPI0026E13DAF|nr:hypothetical protein [Thalassotalea sp. 1_MG-2023]MDO6425419.1 hypothetical protein [Thalassotalea sp. 1_MG-2023]